MSYFAFIKPLRIDITEQIVWIMPLGLSWED
jgi:hypothetical protein